ncbi:MAG: REP-associated tyrosine transposase, partial [Terriglobales bacterium]
LVVRALHGKYDYRRKLPHLQKDNRPVFVSFNSHRRWVLPESVRGLVLDCCVRWNEVTMDLHVAVVMPDHVHVIFTPRVDPEKTTYSLMQIMHAIKGSSARAVNQALHRRGPVWQKEWFDHVLRSSESLREKVAYVCQNPVRAGLVVSPDRYPWLWRGKIPIL